MKLIKPNSLEEPRLADSMQHHRTVLAVGPEAVKRFAELTFGVVGCGGLGMIVTELLSRLGVKKFVLIDPDVVELTNLNRLPGTTKADVLCGTPKTHVAARIILSINPDAEVEIITGDFLVGKNQTHFKKCDIIFGCVDSLAPRMAANHLCLATGTVYFDLGCGVKVKDGKMCAGGGQVIMVVPGRGFCLKCSGLFDLKRASIELSSPEETARQQAMGYVQGEDIPQPSVYPLNMQVASTAMWMMMRMVAGDELSFDGVYIDAVNFCMYPWSEQEKRTNRPRNTCTECGEGGFEFQGEEAGLLTKEVESDGGMESIPSNAVAESSIEEVNADEI